MSPDLVHQIVAFLQSAAGQILVGLASVWLASRFPWAQGIINALLAAFHQAVVNRTFEALQHDTPQGFPSAGAAIQAVISASLPKLPVGVPQDDLRAMAVSAVNGPQTSALRLRASG